MKDDIEKYWKTKRYQEKYESAIQQTESYINALNDNYKQQHGTGFIRFNGCMGLFRCIHPI